MLEQDQKNGSGSSQKGRLRTAPATLHTTLTVMGHVCVAGGGEQAAAAGEAARGPVLLRLRQQQPALLLRQPGL